MNDKHFVLPLNATYGSGGRLTGKRLGRGAWHSFYDEEILKMTSETSAIGEQYFRLADERAGNNHAVPYSDQHEAGADRTG